MVVKAIYATPRPRPDRPGLTAVDCYLRNQTGQMGFARDTGLWAAVLATAWVFDRKTATFTEGGTAGVSTVRRNMRPFSVALLPSSPTTLGWIRTATERHSRSRAAVTIARLKGETPAITAENHEDAFAASHADISAIAGRLPPDCEAQIWAFSDRGEYCTVLSALPFRMSRTAAAFDAHPVTVIDVASLTEVPTA
jgi:hypothetical protein